MTKAQWTRPQRSGEKSKLQEAVAATRKAIEALKAHAKDLREKADG